VPYIYSASGSNDITVADFVAMAVGSMVEREHSGSSNSGGCQTDSREYIVCFGGRESKMLTKPCSCGHIASNLSVNTHGPASQPTSCKSNMDARRLMER